MEFTVNFNYVKPNKTNATFEEEGVPDEQVFGAGRNPGTVYPRNWVLQKAEAELGHPPTEATVVIRFR